MLTDKAAVVQISFPRKTESLMFEFWTDFLGSLPKNTHWVSCRLVLQISLPIQHRLNTYGNLLWIIKFKKVTVLQTLDFATIHTKLAIEFNYGKNLFSAILSQNPTRATHVTGLNVAMLLFLKSYRAVNGLHFARKLDSFEFLKTGSWFDFF